MTVLTLEGCAVGWTSSSPDETVRLGEALGRLLAPGDVVALSGDLGSGKTVLVRGIAAGMGCRPSDVHSPTFTLVNEYRGGAAGGARPRLAHLDLYRIGSEAELPGLGWDEYVGSRYVAAVEWAERAASLLPADVLDVRMTVLEATGRRFAVRPTGPRSTALLTAWVLAAVPAPEPA